MSGARATFRRAQRADLAAIVALLADDVLGRTRERDEDPLPRGYVDAFEAIDADPGQLLVVGELDGAVVATLQLTFIPYLLLVGTRRAVIEGVRVHSGWRGSGVGAQLITWAVDEARRQGCGVVQLTTDKTRVDAQRFYALLGFTATHEGMKLALDRGAAGGGAPGRSPAAPPAPTGEPGGAGLVG